MCIPKLTYIATVIPSLSIGKIKDIEKEFNVFLRDNNPSVVNKVTLHMAKKEGGLGMQKIGHFWRAIKMSWLTNSELTWA